MLGRVKDFFSEDEKKHTSFFGTAPIRCFFEKFPRFEGELRSDSEFTRLLLSSIQSEADNSKRWCGLEIFQIDQQVTEKQGSRRRSECEAQHITATERLGVSKVSEADT